MPQKVYIVTYPGKPIKRGKVLRSLNNNLVLVKVKGKRKPRVYHEASVYPYCERILDLYNDYLASTEREAVFLLLRLREVVE